jgi:hypothetical protein
MLTPRSKSLKRILGAQAPSLAARQLRLPKRSTSRGADRETLARPDRVNREGYREVRVGPEQNFVKAAICTLSRRVSRSL